MTVKELNEYLKSMCNVNINSPSFDRVVIGDENMVVKSVVTMWMPYLQDLKRAKSIGANVVIAHEPTFYSNLELTKHKQEFATYLNEGVIEPTEKYLAMIEKKKQWILENGMAVIRCHDMIDRLKPQGMAAELGGFLGFSMDKIVRKTEMYHVYRMEEMRAGDFAKKVAADLKSLNQPGVAFYGDEDRVIKSVGIGTGCACDPLRYAGLRSDLQIVINDVLRTWIQGSYAADSGDPLIVIDHGTSEELGMKLLGEELVAIFPEIEFNHLTQGCSYKWIS